MPAPALADIPSAVALHSFPDTARLVFDITAACPSSDSFRLVVRNGSNAAITAPVSCTAAGAVLDEDDSANTTGWRVGESVESVLRATGAMGAGFAVRRVMGPGHAGVSSSAFIIWEVEVWLRAAEDGTAWEMQVHPDDHALAAVSKRGLVAQPLLATGGPVEPIPTLRVMDACRRPWQHQSADWVAEAGA